MSFSQIDTHAHVNIAAFKDDWQAVLNATLAKGIAVTNVGTQQDTSRRAVEIAESYERGVYAIIGLHPIHTAASFHDEKELGLPAGQAGGMTGFTSRGEVFDADFYRTLAQNDRVIAIGETGLDYYHGDEVTLSKQREVFIQQIELANELSLPLMIHVREGEACPSNAYDDVFEILKVHSKVPGNIHFYAGTQKQAERFFDIGFTISFTGVITFPPARSARAGAKAYEEIVQWAPLDLIHAETDCPYVAPKAYRGKRCEPWMVEEVVNKIAELKGLELEKVKEQLMVNARKLYAIDLQT